jgi:hypothetical protein
MDKAEKNPASKGESAAVEQPKQPNYTEIIRSQVLAKIGIPPRLDRVEVCHQHHRNYRVNIWQTVVLDKSIVITPGSRIGPSYYLTVSDTGTIIRSEPPMTKVAFDV